MRSLHLTGVAAFLFACALALLPQAAAAATITISITDNAFNGKTIDIVPGDTIVWTNNGSMSHTVTADNGSFDSGTLAPGAKYSQTFNQAGNYPYFCRFHGGAGFQGMSGLIRVNGPSVVQTQPVVQVPTPTYVAQPVTTNYVTNTTPISTSASVNTQAQVLLAQVAQLQQLLASLRGNQSTVNVAPTYLNVSSGACPRIGRSLKPGMSGDDIVSLQQYLATDPSVYPEANTSGYFGALTQAAVQRWQIKYNIVSGGSPDTTGFGMVGPRTAAAISLRCSSGGNITPVNPVVPVVDPNAPTVGGFIQVTPNAGDAPLAVSVVATVNTVNSCTGALYMLSWGDGSDVVGIGVSGNLCKSLQNNYTHTYQYGGQYTIKLSAQGHESTATVLVNGPARPVGPVTPATSTNPTITLSSPSGGQNYKTGDALSIGWSTGGTIPTGASTVFDLFTGTGQKVAPNDVIAITSYPGGTIPWVIPGGSGTQTCAAIYPSGLCGVVIPTGSYKIHATVRQPSTGGNTYGATVVEGDSGIFTIIATPASQPETFTASAASGAAPLTVTFSGTLTSADKGWCSQGCYDLIRYGDGTADFVPLPTGTNASLPFTLTHTYQTTGTYTATLYQGQTITSTPVASPITITVGGTTNPNYSYTTFIVGPTGSSNGLTATATFDRASCHDPYTIVWGDGTSDVVSGGDPNMAVSCLNPNTANHTYTQGGYYIITLKRGPSLSQIDSVGYTISSGN